MSESIKPLEKKYYNDKGVCQSIRIPVPEKTQMYGCPLFDIELIRGRKGACEKGYYYIEEIILGLPHFKKMGQRALRTVKCGMRAIELGDCSHSGMSGRWLYTQFCEVHKGVNISIYPPLGATHMVIENLYTSVSGHIIWEKEA